MARYLSATTGKAHAKGNNAQTMSKVSVIIPAYNQGAYLKEALESVLAQTYPDFEAIVVDDGSTDTTSKVVHAYSDLRICYVYQENRGLSAARNTGIRHAQGEYLTYLDSDDLFLPEKLALLASELESRPDLGFVAGQAIPIDEQGHRIGKIYDAPIPEDTTRLLLSNPLHVGSVMLRREWQDKAGFFDETLRSYEDWDMWLRLVRLGCKTGWVPRPVSLYRFHTAQMTRNSAQMTAATLKVLDKIFSDPTLPESWRQMRDRAYSQAHLRAAASFYHAGDYPTAYFHMNETVRLNPGLLEEEAEPLARHLAALANSPKNLDPLSFVENIYNHLPDSLNVLHRRRRKDLSHLAMQMAFEEYGQGDLRKTRDYIWRSARYSPGGLANRGVLSILLRSILRTPGRAHS
jgi:hypothetical protein